MWVWFHVSIIGASEASPYLVFNVATHEFNIIVQRKLIFVYSSPACLLILNFYTALDVLLLVLDFIILNVHKIILLYWKRKGIRIEKHLQCEKLLGLAGGNTKKHGNKKSGESRTPIRYSVMIHYQSWQSIVNCQVHPSTSFHVTIIHVYKSLCPACIRRNHHKTRTLNIQTLNIIACTKYTVSMIIYIVPWTLPYIHHQCDRIDLGKPNIMENC